MILSIKDLCASKQLDRAAMIAVHGGNGNQANGTSQQNVQNMVAAANVGNGSMFGGPANIQSDNTFTQTASNSAVSANISAFGLFWGGFYSEPVRAYAL